jgi:ubiquinone biosynthesis protein UbiJ
VVTGQPAPASTPGNDTAALADRVRQIRDQAEQLVKELEQLEKDAGTKK